MITRHLYAGGLVVALAVAAPSVHSASQRSVTSTSRAITTQTAPAPAKAPGSGAWVIGFYPWYERFEVTPEMFPYDKVTHVAIGNVYPTKPGTCCFSPDDGFDTFAAAVATRAHAAGRSMLLQIGGAGGNPNDVWNASTSTASGVAGLAEAIVTYATARSFDGVDLDWEEKVDWAGETALAREIRARWPRALITMSADTFDAHPTWAAAAAEVVDRINPMTYPSIGNWGGWDGPWHQGALYETPDRQRSSGHPYSIDRTVQNYLAAGVPASKLGFGMGLYGSGYGDSNGDGRCPSAPSAGWEGEWGVWVVDSQLQLGTIETLYEPVMQRHFDEVARVPYLAAVAPGAGGEADGWVPKLCYITYENVQSATEKKRYLDQHGLGSLILWAAPQDRRSNGSYPVLDALMAVHC